MLRISSKAGGKLACRRNWLLHPHGCEARSAEQPADDHPQHCRGRARPRQRKAHREPILSAIRWSDMFGECNVRKAYQE
jgi:hypothetical protein